MALVFLIGMRWRNSSPALQATLSQVTFAEGVEEYPAWSPDGKNLLYTGEVGKIHKIFRKDLTSRQDTQLTHSDFDELQPPYQLVCRLLLVKKDHQPGNQICWGSSK